MKRAAFLIYAWGSTFLFALLIYWLASIPNLRAGDNLSDDVLKVLFRMTMYAILFILLFRSIIITLKSSVERLAHFRSRNEQSEDEEFVLIIETLVVIVCIVSTVLFAFFEEHLQFYVWGRNGTETFLVEDNGEYVKSEKPTATASDTYLSLATINESTKDILISTIAIILTGMVTYVLPVIGELEYAIKHKVSKSPSTNKKRKSSKK